jgi:hypothetical protein
MGIRQASLYQQGRQRLFLKEKRLCLKDKGKAFLLVLSVSEVWAKHFKKNKDRLSFCFLLLK